MKWPWIVGGVAFLWVAIVWFWENFLNTTSSIMAVQTYGPGNQTMQQVQAISGIGMAGNPQAGAQPIYIPIQTAISNAIVAAAQSVLNTNANTPVTSANIQSVDITSGEADATITANLEAVVDAGGNPYNNE